MRASTARCGLLWHAWTLVGEAEADNHCKVAVVSQRLSLNRLASIKAGCQLKYPVWMSMEQRPPDWFPFAPLCSTVLHCAPLCSSSFTTCFPCLCEMDSFATLGSEGIDPLVGSWVVHSHYFDKQRSNALLAEPVGCFLRFSKCFMHVLTANTLTEKQ